MEPNVPSTLWPVLFEIGDHRVGSYGLVVAAAFLLGLFVARRLGLRDGLDPRKLNDLGLAVLFAGFLGSKLLGLSVALLGGASLEWSELRNAGAVHGGLFSAMLAGVLLARRFSLPLPAVFDAFVPAAALGQAIGRLGCLGAGCCFGSRADLPWAITFHSPLAAELGGVPLHTPLHPVQLYDAGLHIALFALLLWMHQSFRFRGRLFGVWCLGEGLLRTLMESFRGDLGRGVWWGVDGLSTGRLTAATFVVLGLLYLMKTRSHDPS